MKKILISSWPIITLLLLSLFIVWPLFVPGYFSHHDDLQVMRIFEMRKCFKDIQLPCRWVPDMGYGNGFPLYNYYSVLPYYIGGLLSFFFGFIGSAKILFLLPLLLGGVSMYFLVRELFGKEAGFLAGLLFEFAPYRALDSYVRGDVTEGFALSLIPVVFYFSLRLIKNGSKFNIIALALSLGAFLVSHNILAVYFMPVLIIWIIYWEIFYKRKNLLSLTLSTVLGFGLSAFFIIPAFFEKSLVTVENLERYDLNFRANFVEVGKLFTDHSWGYDGLHNISFQIGWPHWWLVAICIVVIFFKFKSSQNAKLAVLFLIVFVVSIFMTHNKSAFIWERFSVLQYSQFPWRFLSISVFSASILGGFLLTVIKKPYQRIFIIIVGILTIALNWSFFKPKEFYPWVDDRVKLTGINFETQQKATILDYLPKTASEPKEKAPSSPLVISGKAQVSGFQNKSNSFLFGVNVLQESRIEVPVFDFPNWQVLSNGFLISHNHDNVLGRISFTLPKGTFRIQGEFRNTPIRFISNIISLISLFALYLILIYGKIRKIFR